MFPLLRLKHRAASYPCVTSIPLDAQSLALAAALIVIGVIVLLIRLILVSRSHAAMKRSHDELETHLLRAQRDLASARDDAAEWRSQMQQQFDSFRAASAGQLTMAEARFQRLQNLFDDASKSADKTQLQLRTELDVLRGMCAQLPFAKTHLQELVSGNGAEEPMPVLTTEPTPLQPLPNLVDEPMLNGANGRANSLAEMPAMPDVDDARLTELEAQIAESAQLNTNLKRELIALRAHSAKVAASVKTKRGRN
jgi:hypothetical protein